MLGLIDESIHVAAVQLTATADKAANLAAADALTRAAASDGARLVLLPEKWNLMGDSAVLRAGAEELDGASIAWAQGIARELAIDLVAGSIMHAGGRNTSVHVGPDGEIRASYAKMHLFDVDIDGVAYRESEHTAPGDAVVSSAAQGLSLGLSVCYDLRFPELYRALAGCEVLLVPAAFTVATTRDHWEILLRARAIENQAYVIAANQIGEHAPGLRSGGRSMIIDPWGLVLAQAADEQCVIHARVQPSLLQRIRRELPALAHRRLP
ncbi:MAG: carbon-nitrogen hydrolase family protein [Solirubrobacteraceae bacterium]